MLGTSPNLQPLRRGPEEEEKHAPAIDVSDPQRQEQSRALKAAQELISLNQLLGPRRTHKAEGKINLKEKTKFYEELERPVFSKGHHTFRT